MSLFSTVPIGSSSPPVEATPRNPGSQEERALNQSVTAAVGIVNEASFLGEGREVQRSIAPGTRTPVIKVVDTKTKEVITQWPPEYLLQLAAELTGKTRDSG